MRICKGTFLLPLRCFCCDSVTCALQAPRSNTASVIHGSSSSSSKEVSGGHGRFLRRVPEPTIAADWSVEAPLLMCNTPARHRVR
ncbi:hypothetical protein F4809DRAFT_606990 [Biscogniauxia mediterranea]|nr:hypothetical protein F4809DRAFT_606990 [Biscogniauxia mediterranea]